jgi:uncharacterized iron-regulated membrane protein
MRFEWLRKSLRQIHLWIGIALGAAIIPLCISGAVLVFGPEIDRLINPSRYAVTSGAADQPAEGYLAAAAAASSGARVITLRW